jgi:hypothetical protein
VVEPLILLWLIKNIIAKSREDLFKKEGRERSLNDWLLLGVLVTFFENS